MQRLKTLLHDDESAVSPVIGVILMVAITVILAAVIASFVLGLGDNTDDVSPNIQFEADWDHDTNSTTIEINTADGNVDPSNIQLTGSAVDGPIEWNADGAEIGAGESVNLTVDGSSSNHFVDQGTYTNNNDVGTWSSVEGDEIVIVFETDSTSDTLDTFEVPEYDG